MQLWKSLKLTCFVSSFPAGDYFNRGIYDLHIIDLKQIPLLEQSPADVMVRYAVKDIMASQASCKCSHSVSFTSTHSLVPLWPTLCDGLQYGQIILQFLGMLTQCFVVRRWCPCRAWRRHENATRKDTELAALPLWLSFSRPCRYSELWTFCALATTMASLSWRMAQ